MKVLVLAVGLLVSPAPAPCSDGPQETPSAKSLAEQVGHLEKQLLDVKKEFKKQIQERHDSAEMDRLTREVTAKRISIGKSLVALAKQNPKDASALKALVMAFPLLEKQPEQHEALALLREHNVENAGIGDVAYILAFEEEGDHVQFATEIVKRNKHPEDQAKALLAIGMIHRRRLGQVSGTDEDRTRELAEARKAWSLFEARTAFERLKTDYGNLKTKGNRTYAERADILLAGLANVANLRVGKQAPEIDGEDVDGKTFKLSDYRGKVVLLDYWAHW
jgi:hypothetical protein